MQNPEKDPLRKIIVSINMQQAQYDRFKLIAEEEQRSFSSLCKLSLGFYAKNRKTN